MTVAELRIALAPMAATADVFFKVVHGSGADCCVTKIHPERVNFEAGGEVEIQGYFDMRVSNEPREA